MNAVISTDPSSPKLSEQELIERILQGEKKWFGVLIKSNNQKLFRIIRSYTSNDESAKDIMQNTYLRAYEKLDQFRFESAFSTWLIRIGINESLMYLRHRSHQKDFQPYVRADFDQSKAPTGIERMNPEIKAIQNETRSLLEHAIDHLPDSYRVVYVMREIEELSNKETARLLDLSQSNIKVRLHRAKIMLKEELNGISDKNPFEFGGARCDDMHDQVMRKL